MWRKDQAQQSQSGAGRHVLVPFQTPLCQRVKEGRCTGHPMPKVGAARKLGCQTTLAGQPA
jgi:hypothetical protein